MQKEVFFYFKGDLANYQPKVTVNEQLVSLSIVNDKAVAVLDNLKLRNNQLGIKFTEDFETSVRMSDKEWSRIIVKRDFWAESGKGILIGFFAIYILLMGIMYYQNPDFFKISHLLPLLLTVPALFRKVEKKCKISFQ